MNVVVDPDRCRGHGLCVEAAPDVFELRDDRSHVLLADPPPPLHDAVEDAILLCPEAAIADAAV